jgi:hypothetical protein
MKDLTVHISFKDGETRLASAVMDRALYYVEEKKVSRVNVFVTDKEIYCYHGRSRDNYKDIMSWELQRL